VKGTSSFLGLEQMTSLAHTFEDVLNKLRKHELTLTPGKMDTMFDAYDIMKELLARIEQRNAQPVDLSDIQSRLKSIGQGGEPETASPRKADTAEPPAESADPAGAAPAPAAAPRAPA
jgi:two-component system chemotaxis sensor kinase CheA